MSLISDVTFYGNWVISILNFIYWTYQLGHSFLLYVKVEKNGLGPTLGIHALLMGANALYVFYELQFHFTPLYDTLVLLTDITGIWCFFLIKDNADG